MLKYFGVSRSRSDPNGAHAGAGVSAPQQTRFIFRDRIFPFSLRITREGTLYLGFVFLLSLAAIGTGNNLMFIILATLLSTVVVSVIVSRNALKQISLSLQLPENVFAGDRVSIKISMTNLKRTFPSFSIRVEDPELKRRNSPFTLLKRHITRTRPAADDDRALFRKAAYFPILRPGETRSELTIQSFPHRGLYNLQGFWISTRFPFGFFRRGRLVAAQGQVLVYPQVREISVFFHLLPFLPGNIESRHVGPGENLFAIRKYQTTESARTIDWKATAKTGELMAREYAKEEESRFCLILDTCVSESSETGRDTIFENSVSFAASIAAHFMREGAGMEFLTPSEYVPRGTGIGHLYRILRSLAVVAPETKFSAPPSDFWSPGTFPGVTDERALKEILSDKVFKIIITSKPRGSFPSAIWRSSHVVFFDEL